MTDQKKSIFSKWWFWVAVVIVIAAIGRQNQNSETVRNEQSTSKVQGDKQASNQVANQAVGGAQSPNTAVQNTVPLPAKQDKFIEIVKSAQQNGRSVQNDMQLGGVKAERDRELCSLMNSFSVNGWIGKIKKVDANSEGKGVLYVELASGISFETWNNSVSDIGDKTLIESTDPVFTSASQMKKGDSVIFSGELFKGTEGECIREKSLTLKGKVTSPEFLFRFIDIKKF